MGGIAQRRQAARAHDPARYRAEPHGRIGVLVPARSRRLAGDLRLPMGMSVWGGDSVRLPDDLPGSFVDAFTGEVVGTEGRRLRVSDALN